MSGTLSLPTTGTFSGLTEQGYINAALAALANASAGALAPTPASTGLASIAGLFWHDTANNLLKLRNQADTAWITVGAVDETDTFFYPSIEMTPGGRLTLVSGAPVITADETARGTIYYDAYAHDHMPIWNGAIFAPWRFTELSLVLDSDSGDAGYHASGGLFDVFAFVNAGTPALGTGPAWTSNTARSAAIEQSHGLWTNAAAMMLRFGNASGNSVSVAANQATYLGTFYATANGQTGMQFNPAAATGGSNPVLGLWNAYNRVRIESVSFDSNANWTYNSSVWRRSDNSVANRIRYLDGLGQSFISADFVQGISASSSTYALIGLERDWASGAPSGKVGFSESASDNVARNNWRPLIGFHEITGVESIGPTGSATFFGQVGGGNVCALSIVLDM